MRRLAARLLSPVLLCPLLHRALLATSAMPQTSAVDVQAEHSCRTEATTAGAKGESKGRCVACRVDSAACSALCTAV